MSDLELLLNRINKLQAEREANPEESNRSKDKWRAIGFSDGLEWVWNEIQSILENKKLS